MVIVAFYIFAVRQMKKKDYKAKRKKIKKVWSQWTTAAIVAVAKEADCFHSYTVFFPFMSYLFYGINLSENFI